MNNGFFISGLFVGAEQRSFVSDKGTSVRTVIAVACGVDCYKVYLAEDQTVPAYELGHPIMLRCKPYCSKGSVGYGNGEIL